MMMTSWRNPQNRHTHPELGEWAVSVSLRGKGKTLFIFTQKKMYKWEEKYSKTPYRKHFPNGTIGFLKIKVYVFGPRCF